MNIRKMIRDILMEDQVRPDEVIDVNDDYAIIKKQGLMSINFFVYGKEEQKIVSSFFHTLEDAREEALTRDTKKSNLAIMNQHMDYIRREVPDFFIQEGGIEEILHFLAQEDGMNLRLQWTGGLPDFSRTDTPMSDNEIERILQVNKVPYSLKDVKARLAQYFIRRLIYNTPKDRTFASSEEALDFIKTYEQQFYYEYLKPMARIHNKK